MSKQDDFSPYVPAEKITPEITLTSIITGVVLAVIFGAANAYLGLRVGMTVSASIPAAVVAMGIIRIVLKRNSILESNIVQTIGSAGESLAGGAIFTLPALFLWASEGIGEKPSILQITLIALIGGLLGVFFMIPLRNALIVQEHGILPYPEGTACAEVLLAGEGGGSNAKTVFAGMGFSALFKFIIDGLKLVPGEISLKIKGFAGEIGTQIYPAVMSVGYICGPKISAYMFAGGVLSWLVLIPILVTFGENMVMYPSVSQTVGQIYQEGGAESIWGSYIRYIGAGALAAGGILSLIKSLPLIITTFKDTMKNLGIVNAPKNQRTSENINLKIVLSSILVLTLLVWLLPQIPVSLLGAAVIVFFGFFFATVSSRMVGLVGSSNNPISGMAIATVLIATTLLKLTGKTGVQGMFSAISIGSVISIIVAIAGDTSQDLKTGYLLGATPKKQQIGEIIGITASAFAIGATLYLLDFAWGFGSEELAAPQATLMKMITEGVMNAQLPWDLVISGVFISLAIELLKIPVLPFAIGIYLPIHLSACIMTGGIIRLFFDKNKAKNKDQIINDGILYSSGMIAGEGLSGIFLALLAVFGAGDLFDISKKINLSSEISAILSIFLFAIMIFILLKFSILKRSKNEK